MDPRSPCKVVNSGGVGKDGMDRVASNATREEEEHAGECDCYDPVYVVGIALAMQFGRVVCGDHQNKSIERCAVRAKLNEELERGFGDDATSPRTEMIHFVYTASNLARVVCAIWFPCLAC